MGSRSANGSAEKNNNWLLHDLMQKKRSLQRRKKKHEKAKTRYLQHLALERKRK